MIYCKDCNKIWFKYERSMLVTVPLITDVIILDKKLYKDKEYVFNEEHNGIFKTEYCEDTDDTPKYICRNDSGHHNTSHLPKRVFSEEDIDFILRLKGDKDYIDLSNVSAEDGFRLHKLLLEDD